MKIYCINFQRIHHNCCGNSLVHIIYSIFKQLDSDYVFLTSSVDKKYSSNIIGYSKHQLFLYRVFSRLLEVLNVPYYFIRTIQEKYIDYLHYRKLRDVKEPYVLITTMYSVKTTKLAKKNGNKVILIAGNLNDNLYFNIVNAEKKRFGLSYTDVYSSSFRIKIYREMMTFVDEVWCNSLLAKDTFNQFNPRKITFPYIKKDYTPKQYSGLTSDIVKIGYIGHTTLLKGVHLFAEAIAKSKYRDKFKFVIVGKIDRYVDSILNRYNINIERKGVIPEIEKESTIKSFDFMCVPSLYDAGPTTIFEGFTCNVPLIVSDGCGGKEYIENNKFCILYKTNNLEDLVVKLNLLYENRQFYMSKDVYLGNIEEISSDDCIELKSQIEELK